ncbi:MAG: hypothetical protein COT15_04255 [Candidatus Diapherotrites archaeon CG08_land_8_20_14_0_20_34_12]|nr:MAG: hypothetical protein COT15_04255 [Candidatus Diapherotrites archaeon CG08_land_8_20_14_0_20_34_12]
MKSFNFKLIFLISILVLLPAVFAGLAATALATGTAGVDGDTAKKSCTINSYSNYPALKVDYSKGEVKEEATYPFDLELLPGTKFSEYAGFAALCSNDFIWMIPSSSFKLSYLENVIESNDLFTVALDAGFSKDKNEMLIKFANTDFIPIDLKNKTIAINLNDAICGNTALSNKKLYSDYFKSKQDYSCVSKIVITNAGAVDFVQSNYNYPQDDAASDDALVFGLNLHNGLPDLYVSGLNLAGLYNKIKTPSVSGTAVSDIQIIFESDATGFSAQTANLFSVESSAMATINVNPSATLGSNNSFAVSAQKGEKKIIIIKTKMPANFSADENYFAWDYWTESSYEKLGKLPKGFGYTNKKGTTDTADDVTYYSLNWEEWKAPATSVTVNSVKLNVAEVRKLFEAAPADVEPVASGVASEGVFLVINGKNINDMVSKRFEENKDTMPTIKESIQKLLTVNAPELVKGDLAKIVKNNPEDLLKAIIKRESNFNPQNKHGDSCGLMQVNVSWYHPSTSYTDEKCYKASGCTKKHDAICTLDKSLAICKECAESKADTDRCVSKQPSEKYIKDTANDSAGTDGYTPSTYCIPWLAWDDAKENMDVGTKMLVTKLKYFLTAEPKGCKELAEKQLRGLMEGITVGESLGILGYNAGEHYIDSCISKTDGSGNEIIEVVYKGPERKIAYLPDVLMWKHKFAGKKPVDTPKIIKISGKCETCNSVLQCLACVDEKAYDQLFYLGDFAKPSAGGTETAAGATVTGTPADYLCKGAKNKIVLVGDSLTVNYDTWLLQYFNTNRCNFTIGKGQKECSGCSDLENPCNADYTYCCCKSTAWMLKQLTTEIAKYDQVVVLGGANDWGNADEGSTVLKALSTTKSNFSKIFELAKDNGKRIIAISMVPRKNQTKTAAALNDWLKKQKTEGTIDAYVDLTKKLDYSNPSKDVHKQNWPVIAQAIYDQAFKAS